MKFEKWFEAQYGKRSKMKNLSDEKLKELISEGISAQDELYERLRYDTVRTVTLYAWQIKDKEKEREAK